MPTPLTPDEEFDAHFRRGLEHYPGLPEAPDDPDAWQRMEALLDAPPSHHLRQRVLRLFGAEVLVLLLLVGGLGRHYQKDLRSRATSPARPETPTKQLLATGSTLPLPANRPQPQRVGSPSRVANVSTLKQAPALSQPTTTNAAAKSEKLVAAAALLGAKALPASMPLGKAAIASQQERTNTRLPAPTRGQGGAAPERRAMGGIPSPLVAHHKRPAGSKKKLAPATLAASTTPPNVPRPAAPRHKKRVGLQDALYSQDYKNQAFAHRLHAHTAATGAAPLGHPLPGKARRVGEVPGPARLATSSTAHAQRTAGERATAPTSHHPRALRRGGAPRETQAGLAQLATGPLLGAGSPPQAVDSLAGIRLPDLRRDALPPVELRLARVTPRDSLPTPKALATSTYRLHIGLVAAPELSTVRQSTAGVGGSLGLQVEYQLARRWRLSTGYLQAIKRYAAAGSDYHTAPAWPSSWMLDEVTANCRIIDVPLNLRYDVWQGPQRRAFVSGGLSSLFMRREDYDYKYEVAGKTYSSAWQFLDNSNHLFQVLNLSVGYEQSLGLRWALQVEPYLKLPLGGIGYGAVRLQSAGVFFSLKYGLLRAPAAR